MSVRVAARAPAGHAEGRAWIEDLMEWFGQNGGHPEIGGQMYPPGVRPAEHENEFAAALYRTLRILVLEFDDVNLAVLFKLRFGGK